MKVETHDLSRLKMISVCEEKVVDSKVLVPGSNDVREVKGVRKKTNSRSQGCHLFGFHQSLYLRETKLEEIRLL